MKAIEAPVVQVNNLHKIYGDHVAVADISFDVQPGEIFGIVGPNGAGKTTTVESIMGLRKPDGGHVSVLGLDPQQDHRALVQRMGVQLQQAALPNRIKVWEALDLFSSFYAHTVPWEPLLDQWGLTEKRNTAFTNLSGGQKQRLFIALALINDPEVVFLDELTTGLDPQARRNTWDLVEAIRAQGKTVILVTHFMDEAEALCDRLAIIDQGHMIALDRPSQLIHSLGGEGKVIFSANGNAPVAALQALSSVHQVKRRDDLFTVYGQGDNLAADVVSTLSAAQVPFQNFRTEQASLEDVFITLTGRKLRA